MKPTLGAQVQANFLINGVNELWIGVVVKVDSTGAITVRFEDEDEQTFTEGDPDFRVVFSTDYDIVFRHARMSSSSTHPCRAPRVLLKSRPEPGPWETWLETYLPDLLLSIFRASRRDPAWPDKRRLEAIENPEFEDAFSDAGTPAQKKRPRRRE